MIKVLRLVLHLILELPIFVKPQLELTFQVVSINVPRIHLYASRDKKERKKRGERVREQLFLNVFIHEQFTMKA